MTLQVRARVETKRTRRDRERPRAWSYRHNDRWAAEDWEPYPGPQTGTDAADPEPAWMAAPPMFDFVEVPVDLWEEEASADVLLEQIDATQVPGPVPDREKLADLVGRPLDDVIVYSGPAVAAALAALGVTAAARDGALYIRDGAAPLPTLAHEIAHALQAQRALQGEPGEPVADQAAPSPGVAGEAPAVEAEAARIAAQVEQRAHLDAGDWRPLPIEVSSAAGAIAYQVAPSPLEPAAPPTAAPATEARAFHQETGAPQAPPPVFREAPPAATREGEAEAGIAARPGVQAPTSERGTAGPEGAEGEETPALAAPEEPAISPEAAAAAEEAAAEREAAQEALAAAEDVGALVETFAGAPPTVKAQYYAKLGTEANRLAQEEEQTFAENVPEFKAELHTEVEQPEPLRVGAPEQGEVALEAGTPPPPPEPDLGEVADPGRYTANDAVASQVRTLPEDGEARARQVGATLRDVQTEDEIEASPGPPPPVPLEGQTDPQRVEDQTAAAAEQARDARNAAHEAVMSGPGPEQVQPGELDEPMPLETPEPPVLEPPGPVEGPQAYLDMGLPPEVQASFDAQQQAPMAESMAESRQSVQTAVETRDTDREAAVSGAEAETQRLNDEADTEQRTQVRDARQTIQDERQATLDAQTQAVADTEAEAEARRSESQTEIQGRVAEDQASIEERYNEAETEAQGEVDTGEREAEAERREAEREAEEQSWWDRAVDFVASAFEALTAAIGAIFDAVRAAVNALLDAAIAFAEAVIDAAVAFIQQAIAAFGELLKGLVNALLADIFPELAAALNAAIDRAVETAQAAVAAVGETLKAGVRAVVEGLRSALNAVLDAFQAAINAALTLVQAALTGDWAAVIRMAFEAILSVAGIDPEQIYAFLGRAQETLQIIIDDPVGFLSNVLDALLAGIRSFADNFLTHLQAGIIGWLTGSLGSMGIEIPERFDLMGVLTLVGQILGITYDRLREKAVGLIGEQNVARIEFVASYLRTLIEGGWGALWERIQGDLATLRDQVLDGIKSFLLERIVMAAITKLATMFNPVGAIVQLILTAYNLYTFLRDQLQRIIEVVRSIVDAIGDIARGIIQPAAQRVEEILARLLPIVIDLLARVLGLGNISARVREILERVRASVDRAIDRLIERVLAMFRGAGGEAAAAPEGAAPAAPEAAAAAAAAAAPAVVGERLPIALPGGATHHLSVAVQGRNAALMVESAPQTVDQLHARWTRQLSALTPQAKQDEARTLLGQLDTKENVADRAADAVVAAQQAPEAQALAARDAVLNAERDMVGTLRRLFELFGEVETGDLAQRVTQTFDYLLDAADPDARPDVFDLLVSRGDEYLRHHEQRQSVRDQLRQQDLFKHPLLGQYRFGTVMRSLLAPELEQAFAYRQTEEPGSPKPDDVNHVITHRAGQVHGQQDPFQRSLGELQTLILDGSRRRAALQVLREEYVESVLRYGGGEHYLYKPLFDTALDDSQFPAQLVYRYAFEDSPEFRIPLEPATNVTRISGHNLRFKTTQEEIGGRRGLTEGETGNRELMRNASHLIADRFMGSGYRAAANLIETSAYYNQQVMAEAENRIEDFIRGIADQQAGGRIEDVTFNMDVEARWGPFLSASALTMISQEILDRHAPQNTDAREELRRQITSHVGELAAAGRSLKRVMRVTYRVDVIVRGDTQNARQMTCEIGPDVYLGMDRGKVGAILDRPSPATGSPAAPDVRCSS